MWRASSDVSLLNLKKKHGRKTISTFTFKAPDLLSIFNFSEAFAMQIAPHRFTSGISFKESSALLTTDPQTQDVAFKVIQVYIAECDVWRRLV